MVSPVSHSNPVSQTQAPASNQPKAAASNAPKKTQPAQDTVTLSKKSGAVDHDGDSK